MGPTKARGLAATAVAAAMALTGAAGLYLTRGTATDRSMATAEAEYEPGPKGKQEPGALAGTWRAVGKGTTLEFGTGYAEEDGKRSRAAYEPAGTKVKVRRTGMPDMVLDTSTPNVASGDGRYMLRVVSRPAPAWTGALRK